MSGQEYADRLKAQIYEDFLCSISAVRNGKNPDVAFRDHEAKVFQLRLQVAALTSAPVRLRLAG